MNSPKIELRRITYNARLSEETNAYAADLYVNGRVLAHVSNDGHGGCDRAHLAKGRTRAELDEVEAHVAATVVGGLEALCGALLSKWISEREYRRDVGRRLLYITPGEKGVRFVPLTQKGRKWTVEQAAAGVQKMAWWKPANVILNTLPEAQALPLYIENLA